MRSTRTERAERSAGAARSTDVEATQTAREPVARRRQPVVVHEDPRRRRLGGVPVLPRRARAARARRARRARPADHVLRRRPGRGARPRTATRSARSPRAGHEIGNHSFRHEPWLHRYSEHGARRRARRAEDAIEAATGRAHRRVPRARATASRRRRSRCCCAGATRTTRRRCPRTSARWRAPTTSAPRSSPPRSAPSASCSTAPGPTAAARCARTGGRWTSRTLLELPVTTHARLQGADPRQLPPDAERVLAGRGTRVLRHRAADLPATGVGPSILLHPLDLISGDDVKALALLPRHADRGRGEARRASTRTSTCCSATSTSSRWASTPARSRSEDLPVRAPIFAAAS